MAKSYAIIIGAILTLLGILGFVGRQVGIPLMGTSLEFSNIANIVHVASGLIGLALGFASGGNYARAFARVFGMFYTLVAVLGFVHIPDPVVTMLNLSWNYNTIHLVVGLFGLLVGFSDSNAFIRSKIKSYRRR
jgi:hypothetical protein